MANTTINTMKGKLLMMAIVLATMLVALAATSKPAEASTFCNSSASAPSVLYVNGQRLIQFPGLITCNATISGADMLVYGHWREVNTTSWQAISGVSADRIFTNDAPRYSLAPRLNCTQNGEGAKFEFRTVNSTPMSQALNGYWNFLPTRQSSPATIYC
jgi:hypothetical protein